MANKVEAAKFVAICNKVGLTVIRQPSQYKVVSADGRKFYIPGQLKVHKVELSGWTHELAIPWGLAFPGKRSPSPKKITHVLNFEQDEKLILKDFYKMAKSLVAVSVEEEPAEEPASSPESNEAPASEPIAAVA